MPPKSYRSKVMAFLTTEQRQDLEAREKQLKRALTKEEFKEIYLVTTAGVIKLKRYHVYGKVVGSKYLGYVDAASKKQAKSLVEKDQNEHCSCGVYFCHQCAAQCENASIEEFDLEILEGDKP